MTMQFYNETEEIERVSEGFLNPEELFLLGFLKSFNRKTNKEWGYLELSDDF